MSEIKYSFIAKEINMKIILIILLTALCCSCTNKKTEVNELNPTDGYAEEMYNRNSIFENTQIITIEGAIVYNNRDTLKVYENKSKESSFLFTSHEYVFLTQVEETTNWFYLTTNNYEVEGYVYIMDITKESFYGNLEQNRSSGNYYRYLQNTEYGMVTQHEAIQRFGPLLRINFNGKTIEFLDTHNGTPDGVKYLLLDYYHDNNEILILKQYWERSAMFIYNLDYEEYRCERIDIPYFNNTRTYMISLIYSEALSEAIEYNLRIFRINNGFYQEIYNDNINIHNSWLFNNIQWINNNEAHIDYGEAGTIIIKIGNEITISSNMIHVPGWWGN